MSEPGSPTLDQLQIFLAVVEEGSFAAAGRRLNRAVSVISYGIGNLEAQLGLTLFTREGTKKPVLTKEGEAILADARVVAAGLAGLRARARGLLEGLEAEVSLAVDVMLPAERLASVLRAFACQFPTVPLRLHVEALGAVAALVIEGRAGLGIAGPVAADIEGLDRVEAGTVTLVPVAAPDHPLARQAKLEPGAGRDHIQLVLTDRSPLTQGRDFAVQSPHTWRLADLGAKHALLREGIGWGNMPLPMIEADLVAGTLVRLAMPDDTGGEFRFSAIYRSDATPGPATSWLMERFAEPGTVVVAAED
ncbi:LysR family transcriptional regulator [Alteriqipengyuania lutimaris]|uniref:LysR family transcriptional regulator n=1 Tax=Alteriqipengyuania lutimaris TaxID=1538146 RepID=A0A395LJZ4_9SPHN|nr:LysR family transcriptional regulator [Alteriqipengyuania lutimaris]MBB3033688.1 DNA-binding transcriptional LysR family regulator [Alteriqipengyuania lutimaris]RDS77326.1 LysR family transcriptional regulator [Alteriqipengyuania lutimaris]